MIERTAITAAQAVLVAVLHLHVGAGWLRATSTSATPSNAQIPDAPVRVSVGFGVDTTGIPNHEVFALWRTYLSGNPDCSTPASAWSRAEQERWPVMDLLCSYVYQGYRNFTIVHLAPAAGFDSTYVIRTLVSRVSDLERVRPLALFRVYATREAGRWVLGNALPRLTRGWSRETIGRVSFSFPPTHTFNRAEARRTALFVDSLSQAFGVPPPSALDYYFTEDLLETFRAMGLDFFPLASDTVGGRAQAANNLVFVGSSRNPEGYRHEVAHIVLAPLVTPNTAGLVAEGLMTWTGGSAGLDFDRLIPALDQYLDTHRDLTLESILTNPPLRDGTLDVGYDGMAVLCKLVHDKGGVAAIRALMDSGREPQAVLTTAAQLLAVSRSQLDAVWRDAVDALSR